MDGNGLSLGSISRYSNHRPRATSEEGEPQELERRVGQLEEDVAMLRLVVGTELLRGSHETLGEVVFPEDDGFPF